MVRFFGRMALVTAALAFSACPDKADDAAKTSTSTSGSTGSSHSATPPAVDAGSGSMAAAPTDAGSVTEAVDAGATPADSGTTAAAAPTPKGELYATFQTSMGNIVVRLFPEDAPKTVQNFVDLAEGKKEWIHPGTQKPSKGRFYDGTIFHRVIPDFMIQGGDPLGQGIGGPGYQFEDEFQSGRRFDKPGLLAMANRGPNTNGSQFFITTSTPSHLNNRHTIFGEVIDGYDVAVKISTTPTVERNKPAKDVVIKKVVISSKKP